MINHWKIIYGALKKNKTGEVSLDSIGEKCKGNTFAKTIFKPKSNGKIRIHRAKHVQKI